MSETTDDSIKVLVVEPLKEPYVKEIGGLEDMQKIVGGHIEAAYPFPDDNVAIVCNESGKIMGLPANRAIMDESGLLPMDTIHGTFFVAALGADDFASLSGEQIRRYADYYNGHMVIDAAQPETRRNGGVPEKKRRKPPETRRR